VPHHQISIRSRVECDWLREFPTARLYVSHLSIFIVRCWLLHSIPILITSDDTDALLDSGIASQLCLPLNDDDSSDTALNSGEFIIVVIGFGGRVASYLKDLLSPWLVLEVWRLCAEVIGHRS